MTPSKLKRGKKCSRSYVYGTEEDCDVIFKVGGCEEEIWRLPAHKEILQESTPVFNAMLSDRFNCHNQSRPITVNVPDVDGRALDNLLRFLYKEEVRFQSWKTALETLYAAHKYQCPDLVKECVNFLSNSIEHCNALYILRYVKILCVDYENLENLSRERCMTQLDPVSNKIPRKTVATSATNENCDMTHSIEEHCAYLLQKCLQFVDKEAQTILCSDEMEDLDWETILLILSRDTLDIPDELMAFSAVLRWADKECKRKQLPLTTVSKREVLSELLFLPRYLVMSQFSFEKAEGPAKSGLFTQEEVSSMLKIICGSRFEVTTPNSSAKTSPVHNNKTSNPYGDYVVHPPVTLCPFIKNMIKPRTPYRQPMHKSPKKKGFRLLEKLKRRGCCSKSNQSQNSSPASSNRSSPVHQQHSRVNQPQAQVSNRFNIVENVFICLACLFD